MINFMKTKVVLMIVAFVLFCFTFSSCKACKDEKRGGGTTNTEGATLEDNSVLNSSDPASPTTTAVPTTVSSILEQMEKAAQKAEVALEKAENEEKVAREAAREAKEYGADIKRRIGFAAENGYVFDESIIDRMKTDAKTTIANAKAARTAGKMVAQAAGEAAKAVEEAIRIGGATTDALVAKTVDKAKTAVAQAQALDQKAQALALEAEATIAWTVMNCSLPYAVGSEELHSITTEAKTNRLEARVVEAMEAAEDAVKAKVTLTLAEGKVRDAMKEAVSVAAKITQGLALVRARMGIKNNDVAWMMSIREVMRLAIEEAVAAGILTQADAAESRTLAGI
jgi:hypothetical protein